VNRDDRDLLVISERLLEEYRDLLSQQGKENASYWIPKAMFEVVQRRNMAQAELLLKKCQAVELQDPSWRLSLAFVAILRADYQAALRHYDGAFQLNPAIGLVLDIEGFVHWWIEKQKGPPALYLVGADPNLSHRADRILSQGWKPTLRRSAVDKCSSLPGSLTSLVPC